MEVQHHELARRKCGVHSIPAEVFSSVRWRGVVSHTHTLKERERDAKVRIMSFGFGQKNIFSIFFKDQFIVSLNHFVMQ